MGSYGWSLASKGTIWVPMDPVWLLGIRLGHKWIRFGF